MPARSTWRLGLLLAATAAITLAVLGRSAVAASRSHASAVGEVSLGSPVKIATFERYSRRAQAHASVLPDPVQGGWVVLDAPAELIRIDEHGAAGKIPVPAALQGPQFAFTPLKDGWGVATARVFPGGHTEEEACYPGLPGSCGVMVVAQLSPTGSWTPARRLPHSSGSESSGFDDPAQAIESEGRIELTWCEECSGGGSTGWIALARPGGRFGRPHRVRRALRIEVENEFVETFRGRFYIRARFGVHLHRGEQGDRVVEREIYPSGQLGPEHFMRSPLVRLEGLGGGPYPGKDNSEVFVFGAGDGRGVGVALRRGWQSKLGRPQFLEANGCCPHVAVAPDHWMLILTNALIRKHWRLVAAEVTPGGRLEATREIERNPVLGDQNSEFGEAEAIDNAGQALIASSPPNLRLEEPTSIWLDGATQRCRIFSRSLFIHRGTEQEEEEISSPEMFAGAHDVFHLVWADQGQLEATTARVGCAGT